MSRRLLIAALTIAAGLTIAAPSAGAAPTRPLTLGTADPGYASSDAVHRDRAYDATVDAKAGVVRISAFWFAIAPNEPSLLFPNMKDPRNPAYDFERLDAAVRDARSRGLEVILTLQRAPNWAEGPDEPAGLAQGVWKPDPVAFGDFAQAVATRYSGNFAPDPILEPNVKLPRVRYYQAWNEANLRNHLMPQYSGATPVSVEIYRDLLNEAYAGINAADSSATVVAAGTAPLQSNASTDRVGPLTFWRKLLCLSAGLQATPCPGGEKASFDVFDHHPITFRDPNVPGTGDSVLISDFDDLTEVWRAAESRGTVAPGRRPMWTTEIYWETNPPEAGPGAVSPSKAAEYLQRGIRSLYQDGVGLQLNFFLVDPDKSPGLDYRPGGLLYDDFRKKPSFTAFRFPFVTERKNRRTVAAWGKSPVGGRLRIERKVKGRWKAVKTISVSSGAVFATNLGLQGKASLRAKVGGATSLVFNQRG